jgi:hypothetical protein
LEAYHRGCGQLLFLNRRLSALQQQIAGLNKKLDAAKFAQLDTGLGLLRQVRS